MALSAIKSCGHLRAWGGCGADPYLIVLTVPNSTGLDGRALKLRLTIAKRPVIYLSVPRPANPETRSRLLEKGGDLVSIHGFNATGVQEITAAAGVPKGSFYNYFASKEAFAVEVLTDYWDAVMAAYGPILTDDTMAPLARIARYFAGLVEFHERRRYAVGCLIGNMAIEVTPSSESVRIKLAAIYRQWTASLTECLREAQGRGELPAGKDAVQLAAVLVDAFEGAVTRAKVERSRSPFDNFEALVLPAFLA